jgi:hypothetical protein
MVKLPRKASNETFKFELSDIERIKAINLLLDKKYKSAYELAEQFEQQIIALMVQPGAFITDYEIEFKVSLFANKKYEGDESMEGNPFFEFEPSSGFLKKGVSSTKDINDHKNWLFCENHNIDNHLQNQPLKNMPYCIIMHELIEHCHLGWQDIIDIDEVWFEVVVKLQNIVDIN